MTGELPRSITQEELDEAEGTPGLVRRVAFQTDNNTLVQVHADGGVSSGWHHHGDRHVYAHLMGGTAVIEHGLEGNERLDVEPGGFFYLPPGTVHRDVNPSDEPQEWIISFVGTGPLVENVDGPDPERSLHHRGIVGGTTATSEDQRTISPSTRSREPPLAISDR